MKLLYLDHNIFIQTLDNGELKNFLNSLSDKNIQVVYSSAHIEEIYKVLANKASNHHGKMRSLLQNIDEITSCSILHPTPRDIQMIKEAPICCYKRVKEIDTRQFIEDTSLAKLEKNKNNFTSLLKEDKSYRDLSNFDYKQIWEKPSIKNHIDCINCKATEFVGAYNHEQLLQAPKKGFLKQLPLDFCLCKNNFNRLKKSYVELETTIEWLFNILDYFGYNYDNKEITAVSGTHDVTHSIYSTKADVLVSTDRKFIKKCRAVYYYLGVETKVILCSQQDVIKKINENILDL